ncbi:MAG: DNA starvation/stationary phase protection protein, partial [Rhodothermales bacterium]|nr:DNA starvation/stationary phase protection protein [Rhodothermales bacterium]
MPTSTIPIETGISEESRTEIADGLAHLLADSYLLYVKTHNFHWNVTGPMFVTLHELFEQHYTELSTAIDEIAERIRALGSFAPGSFSAFKKLASIEEETGNPEAHDMVLQLIQGQEAVVRTVRKVLPVAADADDEPTVDLLTQRMQIHEKNAW